MPRESVRGGSRWAVLSAVMGLMVIVGCNSDSSVNPVDPGQMGIQLDMEPVESVTGTEVERVEVELTPWGSGDEVTESLVPENGMVEETITGLEPGQWDLFVQILAGDDEVLGDGSETGIVIESGETTEVSLTITIWVDPDTGELHLEVHWNFEERRMSADEDCFSHDVDEIAVKESNGTFQVVEVRDGSDFVILSYDNEEDAERALEVIQGYHLTERCYVGRPDPPMTYWLQNGLAPRGDLGGEDCTFHDYNDVEVTESDGSYRLMRDDLVIINFGSDEGAEEEAEEALSLIRKYQFSYYCYVSRPDPPMMYLKAE